MDESMPDAVLIAIASGAPVAIEGILAVGADIDAAGVSVTRNALTAAVYAARSDFIGALVEHGASLEYRSPDWGIDGLHEAA